MIEIPEPIWAMDRLNSWLTPEEVARDLNTIEGFWTKRPGEYYTGWGGPFDDFKYTLYVGTTDPSVCSLCGEPADYAHNYGVSRRCIQWTDHTCNTCGNLYRDSVEIFGLFPIPKALIGSEHIQRFMERRSCLRELSSHAPSAIGRNSKAAMAAADAATATS